MNETTAILTNDDINCKAISTLVGDMIVNEECDYFYEPQQELSYITFNSAQECYDFIEHICSIKEDIIYLYDCYNCNN